MRNLMVVALSVMIALCSGLVSAQNPDQSRNEEMADGRAMIRASQEEIIRSEMNFSSAEAAAFWPIYRNYQTEMTEVWDQYTAIITDYVQRYNDADLSDEYANELIDGYLDIQQQLLNVKKDYLPKFKQALAPLKVAQFYQLENKITAEINAQLAVAIPLIDPT